MNLNRYCMSQYRDVESETRHTCEFDLLDEKEKKIEITKITQMSAVSGAGENNSDSLPLSLLDPPCTHAPLCCPHLLPPLPPLRSASKLWTQRRLCSFCQLCSLCACSSHPNLDAHSVRFGASVPLLVLLWYCWSGIQKNT